jgi:hypothetical protein
MTAPTYDILILSIVHRDALLRDLLAELDRQMRPGVGVIVYRDNLEARYSRKSRALIEASSADYTSFIDDDDMVVPDFIARVTAALESRPDYVGFPVRWTIDGVQQIPVVHSLRYGGWRNHSDILVRDIVHFNPIRRELALAGSWDHPDGADHGADGHWAYTIRQTGLCRTEAWIPDLMYFYRFRTGNSFLAPRQPMPADQIPPLPSYPWLRSIDGSAG